MHEYRGVGQGVRIALYTCGRAQLVGIGSPAVRVRGLGSVVRALVGPLTLQHFAAPLLFFCFVLRPWLVSNSCQCSCLSFLGLCWNKACSLVLFALPCWRNDLKAPVNPCLPWVETPPTPTLSHGLSADLWLCWAYFALCGLGHWGLGCTPDPLPALGFCLTCPSVPRTLSLSYCLFGQFTWREYGKVC